MQKEQPSIEISVIVPIYNGGSYLSETLDSIVNQTVGNIEVICVNDGSTDNTPSILAEFHRRDRRFTVINQPNSGPGAARNTGLDHANGQFVIMLDADDVYEPDLLENLVSCAKSNNADVVVCRSTQFEDQSKRPLESWWTIKNAQLPKKEVFNYKDMPDFIFSAFIGWPWDKLYKRSFVEENRLRFPELSNSEDLFFVFLSLTKASSICVIDKPLIHHRVHGGGSVSTSRANNPLDFYTSTSLLKKELQRDPQLYATISWSFLNWAFGYMIWNIETMNDSEARAIQLNALASNQFPELEISIHSPSYFSLDPSAYPRYLDLLNQALHPDSDKWRASAIKRRLLKLRNRIRYRGVADSLSFVFGWIRRRLLHKNIVEYSELSTRGSDYAKSIPQPK